MLSISPESTTSVATRPGHSGPSQKSLHVRSRPTLRRQNAIDRLRPSRPTISNAFPLMTMVVKTSRPETARPTEGRGGRPNRRLGGEDQYELCGATESRTPHGNGFSKKVENLKAALALNSPG